MLFSIIKCTVANPTGNHHQHMALAATYTALVSSNGKISCACAKMMPCHVAAIFIPVSSLPSPPFRHVILRPMDTCPEHQDPLGPLEYLQLEYRSGRTCF